MPAVSIIMNVRNGATTLHAAIESVLAQTAHDWELIVWDDCSTDDSAAVAKSFKDPRIRYVLAPQPASLGQARDAAMRLAHGEWLAFLDQDDLWLPRKLEQQLTFANDPQVGLIYGRTLCFCANGGQWDHDYFHEFTSLPEGNIFAALFRKGCFPAMSSAMIRRSAVFETGGIPGYIHITPDYFLYLAVASKYQARAVQQVVCRYRVHAGSMTSVYRRESLAETLRLIDDWRDQVGPASYAQRRMRVATALAVEELRTPSMRLQGFRRVLHEGSLVWLTGRPFVHLWRRLRRRLRRPYFAAHSQV